MVVRFVKMRFRQECIADFVAHFEAHKERIRGFEGCEYLQVLQQAGEPQVWMTHSHWRSEADLEAYRKSDLFAGVWAQTKQWFEARPEAWSMEERYELV